MEVFFLNLFGIKLIIQTFNGTLVRWIKSSSKDTNRYNCNIFHCGTRRSQSVDYSRSKAPQAAGRIHTDFEKGFIMAEVMKFDDFKEEGSEAACKSAGKYRQQGRNYTVEDGDIIFFKFNAGAGLKEKKK
uniref:YchF C-terminal domain-containing protein n=1 Tax=Strigamia maritima TaxID=126957 RepID=T1JKL5_STRMM